MKLSGLIAKLTADLNANGDTEHISLGIIVAGTDGERYRLDAVLVEDDVPNIVRDPNYKAGMSCIVADYRGEHVVDIAA